MNISNRILVLMGEKNISYGELSHITGIPKSALHRYTTGETPKIPLARLEKIAVALQTTPTLLTGWEKDNGKESFSKRLQFALAVRNMRQSELCLLTKIPKSSISLYLSGAYEPKQDRVYKIAKVLNVSEMWLWGYDVPMKKNNIPIGEKLTDEEVMLLDLFKNVPKENRGKALEVLRIFSNSQ